MIIKESDGRSQDIAALNRLLSHPNATKQVKDKINDELRMLKAGVKEEQSAAYNIDFHFSNSKNWMVLHDLRLEHADAVAQIDHLIINRTLEVFVCESKSFSEGFSISEQGEFTQTYQGKEKGITSPIEQNKRHIHLLDKFFAAGCVKLPSRLGFTIKPSLSSLILVSNTAIVRRPPLEKFDSRQVIKNDQFFTSVGKTLDEASALSLAKAVSSDTLEALAREIAGHHKAITFDYAKKFGLDSTASIAQTPSTRSAMQPKNEATAANAVKTEPAKSTLQCHSCTDPVSPAEAKFCRMQKNKFGGNLYCRACQAKV